MHKKKEKKKKKGGWGGGGGGGGIFCRIEWVAETHRNMCTCVYNVTHGSAIATKWPARVKKAKKRGPERPAYSRNSSNADTETISAYG